MKAGNIVRGSLRSMAVAVFILVASATAARPQTAPVVVDITPGHAINNFHPAQAIGAGVDSQTVGAVSKIYAPKNVSAMLSSGLGPVSYRLYTELSIQDWHWNPNGKWSDPAGQGYWTGDLIRPTSNDSFGYRLPHRGFTTDQGNNDDYSRLDDGDPGSFWKSNPYLTSSFAGEADHPQWVVVDLRSVVPVNAIRLAWSAPYATSYQVQYWNGPDAINDPGNGNWVTFAGGKITAGSGGTVTLKLAPQPVAIEFVRVLMTASSNTCDVHGSHDIRNCVGFAIAEVGLGTLTAGGVFHDLILHRPNNTQTPTYASSVDPWHASGNRVLDQEQAGLDIVYHSGLTRGMPAMMAVSMLYGTPDDAAAQIRYLELHHDPISYVELGEEPDGQYIAPEDYGALYLQWARALHRVDTRLKLGGPVFQGVTQDVQTWRDAHGDTSWLHRFLRYLRSHGRLSDLSFMSFEHYPFGACDTAVAQNLYDEPDVVHGIIQTWLQDGLPRIPMFITETNYSASSSAVMQDISGGLWLADFEASFLSNGGSGTFLYQYEPEPLVNSASSCATYGAWGLFAADNNNQIRQRTSQFFAAQMITQQWSQPVNALHTMYPALLNLVDPKRNRLVTAYALLRPNGSWALLLINKDPEHPHAVNVVFRNAANRSDHYFSGSVSAATFGAAQYAWHPNGADGFANPDGPILISTTAGGKNAAYTLPRASITVLAGQVR